jgi:hypothetical protein
MFWKPAAFCDSTRYYRAAQELAFTLAFEEVKALPVAEKLRFLGLLSGLGF